jgi:hypothetical protein
MADGAGTPYCADEGRFSPLQEEHMRANARADAEYERGRREARERLVGTPCVEGKQHDPIFTFDGWLCAYCHR